MTVQEVRNKFIKNPSDQYYTAKQLVDLGIADDILQVDTLRYLCYINRVK